MWRGANMHIIKKKENASYKTWSMTSSLYIKALTSKPNNIWCYIYEVKC